MEHLADVIVRGAYIGMWFVGAGVVSVAVYQIPVVKNWFKNISA